MLRKFFLGLLAAGTLALVATSTREAYAGPPRGGGHGGNSFGNRGHVTTHHGYRGGHPGYRHPGTSYYRGYGHSAYRHHYGPHHFRGYSYSSYRSPFRGYSPLPYYSPYYRSGVFFSTPGFSFRIGR